jgi:hypothetical protein
VTGGIVRKYGGSLIAAQCIRNVKTTFMLPIPERLTYFSLSGLKSHTACTNF